MIKVFIMCPGLGHIGRGYESFSREQFDVLKDHKQFDLYLFKGAGSSLEKEHAIPCLKRTSFIAKTLSKIFGIEPYSIEQLTFSLSSIPYLIKHKPDIILYSDFIFGVYMWYLRKLLKFKYKLLFSNGAPNGPPYSRCDHVQQLLPSLYKLGVDAGEPASKFTLLPYGAYVSENFSWPTQEELQQWRRELNLPVEKKIIISVGAINKYHKRMHYLIKEMTQLPLDEYYLLVLGSRDPESDEIIEMAHTLLPTGSFMFKTVPFQEISRYYLCADIFVLCSLGEGFGRVYLEALMHGLPVFAHDYPVSREVMVDMAYFLDMTEEGALSSAILNKPIEVFSREQKREFVFKRYDWSVLKGQYVAMIQKVIQEN